MVASAGWGEDHIKGLPNEWMSIAVRDLALRSPPNMTYNNLTPNKIS